jgi:hypothetical protein
MKNCADRLSKTEYQDERNKRLIAHSLGQRIKAILIGRPLNLTLEQVRLIESATPQEREAYVKRQAVISFTILLCVAVAIGWAVTRLGNPQKFVPTVSFEDAGSLKELQLHETTFSTATTVTTTAGVFQARGGVSGATGDQVRIKSTTHAVGGYSKSLCVDSSLKADCYPLK